MSDPPRRHAVAVSQRVNGDRGSVDDLALCDQDVGQAELAESSASHVMAVAEGDDVLCLPASGGQIAKGLKRLAGFGCE